MTNAHVVSGNCHSGRASPAQDLIVKLPNGSETIARLLAKDDEQDVAILQVEKSEKALPTLVPLKMGDSKALRAGQWVMAMGHPWGVPGVAVAGIVIGAGPDLPESAWNGQRMDCRGLGPETGTLRRAASEPSR